MREVSARSTATAHWFAHPKRGRYAIVCLRPGHKNRLEVYATLVHEAVHIWQWIKEDKPGVRDALRSLPEDASLGCFCAPRECHCDIIPLASAWVKANIK